MKQGESTRSDKKRPLMGKKFLAALLTLTMVVAMLPAAVLAADEAAIQLGSDGIGTDDKVYFGSYTESVTTYDVPWLVLNKGASEAFMLSEYLLGKSSFDGGLYGNLRTLHDAMSAIYAGFGPLEQGAIASPTQGDLAGQKLFALSLDEASTGTGKYFADANARIARYITNAASDNWWLRTRYDGSYIYCVTVFGADYTDSSSSNYGVRPAFNLDLTKVLFTSAAVDGKKSGDLGAGALNENTAPTGITEWKLTIKDYDNDSEADGDRDGFTATTSALSAASATVNYSGAKTGTNEYISAMIVDNGNVSYYGRIKALSAATDASGTISVNIPNGITLDSDTILYVFNEQYNGDKKTDYASELKAVMLEYDVWVGGVRVTSVNMTDVLGNGKVSYNPANATVTLNGAAITLTGTSPTLPLNETIGIYSMHDITIQLVGNNTINTTQPPNGYGIMVRDDNGDECDITLSGGGSLTINSTGHSMRGQDITFTSDCGTINVTSENSAGVSCARNLTVEGGNITAAANNLVGIYVPGNITISGGSVTATGYTYAIGIEGALSFSGGYATPANRSVMVGNAAPGSEWDGAPNHPFSNYKYVSITPASYNVWVQGTEITYANKDNVLGDGKVSYNPATSTLTLNGATITATGNSSPASDGIYSTHDIAIALAGTNTINANNEYGIFASGEGTSYSDITVSGGGSLTVTSKVIAMFGKNVSFTSDCGTVNVTSSENDGIYCTGNLTVAGGNISAASNSLSGYHGLEALGNITISGGIINATGTDAGMTARGNITISGGSVTATGDTYAIGTGLLGSFGFSGDYTTISNRTVKVGDSTPGAVWSENDTLNPLKSNYKYVSITPAGGNSISGITAGKIYTSGSTVTFTANGAGMNNQSPNTGDVRWLATAWQTNPSGDFASGYTQSFSTTGMSLGQHTLTVTFAQQSYNGTAWENTGVTDTKTVSYTIAAAGTANTANVAPKTGDSNDMYIYAALMLLSALGIVMSLKLGKKKNKA